MQLREAKLEELKLFSEMENKDETKEFILPNSLEEHQTRFSEPNITYLSIENKSGRCAGFFILAIEENGDIEFKRVVISKNERGIGQDAIIEMEEFCENNFKSRRIWLDVFEFNYRGIHIYEKLGYKKFNEGEHNGKRLFYYEKEL